MQEEIAKLESYELLDSGDGMRLERFGKYVLSRPDPAVLWHRTLPESVWMDADAMFVKGETEERGNWQVMIGKDVPERWRMQYAIPGTTEKISFITKLSPFKHTGVFPEQASNWNFLTKQVGEAIKAGKQPADLRVLNLFGYTGIASVLVAKLGCSVTHVDASKPSITWAKENMLASELPEDAIRWILDDCLKFVKREVKRGVKYDAIIMDPPAFGRGAKGEVWKFNENLPELFATLPEIVSEDFQFLIVNAYAVSVSAILLKNMLQDFAAEIHLENPQIEYGELLLAPEDPKGKDLSTGLFARLAK